MTLHSAFTFGFLIGTAITICFAMHSIRKLKRDCFRILGMSQQQYLSATEDACRFATEAAKAIGDNKRLRQCLQGVSNCSTCSMCRGAADIALGLKQ